jgi:sucrose-phosphate synthase
MHIAFLNPQGNFDPQDSYWTEHPDFGGQLVYVKQVALAMGEIGHQVDILTRQIIDPDWPEFKDRFDSYPDAPNVRIIRLPAGPDEFLRKELLWPHLIRDWVPAIIDFYQAEGGLPEAFTAHYGDGGLVGALLEQEVGIPYSFTAHSLGAQKMDKMGISENNIAELDQHYYFRRRILAERLSMNRSALNITSTLQERYVQYSHNAYRGSVDWTDDDRFAIIPPGVNLEIFDKSSRYSEEEQTYQYLDKMLERDLSPSRQGKPCIVASSRLDPKKNHLGLVEAYACSTELREHANLVIITGNLPDPLNGYPEAGQTEKKVLDDLIDVIEGSDLRGQVSMFAIQGQRQLGAAYRYFAGKQSIFALTALYEPFGLAPLEAMAAGMPAVVTKFGGPSESLLDRDQEYGLLVDPGDTDEVSTAIYSLVNDQKLWEKYAAAGHQRVHSRYIWKKTAEGYIDQLKDAASGKMPPRDLLPFPEFFQDPKPENDIQLAELKQHYLEFDLIAVGETLVDFISLHPSNSLRTAEEFRRFLGGQPANVAVYVSKLGGKAAVLSKIGEDRFGEFLEDSLLHHGVSTTHLQKTDQLPTTSVFLTKTTRVPDSQVNSGADTLLDIHDFSEELIHNTRVVHTSCFALSREPARSAVRRALRIAHRAGKIVSLDPNCSPKLWPDKLEAWDVLAQVLPYVSIVKPSLEDARLLFDPNLSDSELESICLEKFHELGAEVVILTRSGGLVTVSDGTGKEEVGPLPLVDVNSVIGGSDAFWAGLLIAHLDGKSWKEAVCFAHEIAALKLQNVGHVDHLIQREQIYMKVKDSSKLCS